ncbi:hypothetical protein [Streptomyces sp. NPDC048338]|uniref:hypothetical protein n=1 Tax=Streptomyces sp. NPDC048338 TaxID=3365536 RepID=UPI0037231C2C
MLTVTGSSDHGATYTVQITGQADRPVIGSYRAAALIELHLGKHLALSPTGPMTVVAGDDEASVLTALRQFTTFTEETGAVPKVARVPEG